MTPLPTNRNTEVEDLREEIDRLTFLHKQDHALADRYQEHREAAERELEQLRGRNKTLEERLDQILILANLE